MHCFLAKLHYRAEKVKLACRASQSSCACIAATLHGGSAIIQRQTSGGPLQFFLPHQNLLNFAALPLTFIVSLLTTFRDYSPDSPALLLINHGYPRCLSLWSQIAFV